MMPKNNKRVMSEVYHYYKYMCMYRFELTDDDTQLVKNLKGN